jgi:hypothetical protein
MTNKILVLVAGLLIGFAAGKITNTPSKETPTQDSVSVYIECDTLVWINDSLALDTLSVDTCRVDSIK